MNETEFLKQQMYQTACGYLSAMTAVRDKTNKSYLRKQLTDTLKLALEKLFGAPKSNKPRHKVDYRFVSEAFLQSLLNGTATKETVTYEHVIPTYVLIDRMLLEYNASKLTYERFCELMAFESTFICGITVEENRHMSYKRNGGLGLNSRMPAGWKWGDDVWARYRVAGIHVLEKKSVFEQIF